jgi:hypothetical protein
MSYQGICGTGQNIPASGVLDNYFHANSLERMVNYINNTNNNQGGSCPTTSATGNTPPVTNANPCSAMLTIPISTPFSIDGTATDANGDNLTICWEQYDEDGAGVCPTHGFIGATAGASAIAPLFRSYPPTSSTERIFPKMEDIVTGTTSDFEVLPTVGRTLNFRMTTRDNNASGGGMSCDAVSITVDGTAGPFLVSTPNGGETLTAGGAITVTWDEASTNSFCADVNIRLSVDGGYTYPYLLASDITNTAETWTGTLPAGVPNVTTARVKVECAAYDCMTFFDISDNDFTITSSCLTEANYICPTAACTFPVGDPGLNLSVNSFFGNGLSSQVFDIDPSDPEMDVVTNDIGGTGCFNWNFQVDYEHVVFTVDATGDYTFSHNTGFTINSVFTEATFDPNDPCPSFLGSNATNLGGGMATASGSFTVTLTECTEYRLCAYNFGTAQNYTVTMSGAGSLNTSIASPGVNYSHTFVAVNTLNDQIDAQDSGSDFTTLAGGSYQIYGASYKSAGPTPPNNVDPNTWIGQTISAVLTSGDCALFSTNFKSLTITGGACSLSTSGLTNVACNDNGTGCNATDDYITFDLNPTGTSLGATYNVTVSTGTVTPTSGTYGSATTFQLQNGSAGGGNVTVTITDVNDPACTLMETITDPGTCSTACGIPSIANSCTTPLITFSGFTGAGFTTNPGAGELCSNNWLPSGFSDNNYIPCGNNTSGDWARGSTAGGVGTGGIYAYDDGAGNQALWIQPGGSDFTPGDITLQLQNTTGAALTDIDLSYDILFLNDQNRTNSLNFSYSIDGTNFTAISSLDFATPAAAAGSPTVMSVLRSTTISGLNISNNAFFWVRWTGNDVSGSGARDEYGLDNIAVCKAACNLVASGLNNVQCNNNGTPSDTSDDYITFELNPTGISLGTAYTVTGATLTPSTGNYGAVTSFQTNQGTAGAGDLNLTITDNSDGACTLAETVTDPGTCSPDCEITGDGITNIQCNNNGTPSDNSDDYITFDLNPTGNNLGTSYTVSGTNLTPSTGNYGAVTSFQTDPGTAGAGNINLTLTDNNDGACTWAFTLTDPGSCSPDCEITASGLANVACNDNGTTNNPFDDYITFDLNPTGFNLGTSYTVSGATLTPSGGNYGGVVSYQTAAGTAGAGDLNLTITDDALGTCTFTFTVTDPGTCSPDCVILTTGLSNIQCNNNGTPSNDTDDYITFDLNPTGNNIGATYTVLGTTLTPTGGNFGGTTSFQTDPGTAGAGNLNLTIRDDNEHGCTLPFTVTDPGSCSTDCELLTSGLNNIHCNNNGTPSNVSDDYITFELNPTGNNLGTSYTVSGATLTPSTANYGSATTFQTAPGTAGAGDLNLTITDDNSGSCTLSVMVTDPGNCSPNCEITASGLANIQCNNNGTVTDDTDDYITFELNPTGFNLGTSYTVSGATLTPSGGNYGAAITYQTNPGTAGAGDLNLTITDDSNGGCTLAVTVTDPGTCSSTCNLSATGFSNLLCNNNGTPYDPSDDYFTFDLNPTGVNLSTNGYNVSSSVTISPSSGTYGSAASFSTPIGSAGNGNLTITVTDKDDAGCTASSNLVDPTPSPTIASTTDPATCGGLGSITLGGLTAASAYNVVYDLGAMTDIFSGPFTANASGEIVLNNLSQGTYTNIRVQDNATGCIGGSLSATLTDPMTPTYTVAGTDPTTCNGSNGSFTISGLTANTNFDVSYDDDGTGVGPLSLTSDGTGEIIISNLNAGSYTNIVVTFATNCSGAAASVTLSDPASPNPNISASTDPSSCGGSDGTITLGGLTSGETYTVNYDFNGSGASQTGLTANGSGEITLTGLSTGNYTNISVTNESTMCSGGSLSQTLSDPSAPTPALGTLTNPSACGSSDGSIQLTGLNANTSYDVNYDQDGNPVGPISLMTNASGELTVSNLPAGNYTNIIVALAGCSSSPLSATLSDPNSPSLTETHVDVTCPGGTDGSIDLTVTGGTPIFTYDWDNDGTGDNDDLEDLNGLSAGTYNVTVTDMIGCTATLSVIIADGTDNTPPTALCQGATVQLDGTGNATITTGDIDNGSNDNCGTANLSLDNSAFDCSNIGANTVTLTVDDGNGNSATCNATVTVEDNMDPTAACQGTTVQLDGSGNATITTGDIDNGSNDNCGTANLSLDNSAFDCSNIGANTVILTVDDGNGNSATCTATVTVEDNMDPTAACKDATVQLDGSGNATITTADIDNGSNDNCGTANLSLDNSAFDCSNIGANTVTLTVDDGNGNSATCTATVTVEDNLPPVLVCQDITVSLNSVGQAMITTANVAPTSSDNCGNQTLSLDINSFNCSNLGANTVTVTSDDGNGNIETCTSSVTIIDDMDPMTVCQDATVQLDGSGNATISTGDIDNGSTDNCGTANLSLDITTFDCSNVGANTVTLTVDDGNGNSATCTATVTVEDNESPVAVCQDITVQLDGSGNISITAADIDGGSSDNCATNLSASTTSFDCSNIGGNTVTLTVDDGNGNSGSCMSNVTVEDNEPPVLVCQDITVSLNTLGQAMITTTNVIQSSGDNCGTANLSLDIDSFDCSNIGGNSVTVTGDDGNGNTNTCSAIVTIADDIDPTAVCQDITVQLDAGGNATITPADIDNGSSDNCGIASSSVTPTLFTCAELGANTVNLSVLDVNGNTGTCSATVTVADDNNPCCDAPMAVCQNISVDVDAIGLATITASDIDGGSLADCGLQSITATPTAFDCLNLGANTVTLTITDILGNSDNCDATVLVGDPIAPVAVCQDITVTLDLTGTAVIVPADIDNGSSDNCSVISTALDLQSFSCANVGTNTVTLTVTDNSGNATTCTATVGVIASTVCTPPDILNEDGPNIKDPCTCRGNGAFDEEVVITSGSNQAWEVVSTTLLDPNNLLPFAAGTLFNEIVQGGGQSEYVLSGVHLDGIGYTIEAFSPFWPNQPLSISNTCNYPDAEIENLDDVICIGTTPFILQGNGGSGVSGDGTFTINGVAGDVFDPAVLGVGTHIVSFTFDAGNPASLLPPADVGCTETVFTSVVVVETPASISCNNLENVSLDDNCQALITPDMVLEGTYFCDDDYTIEIEDYKGDPVQNPVSGSHIGEDLTVTVTHTPTGNSCWGTINVEDKSAPTVTCQDRTISCTSNLNGVPKASGSDNCDNSPTVNLIDEVINTNDQCTDPTPNDGIAGYVTIERTYIAIDDFGNESAPCTQTITITRPEPGLVDFPNDVTRQCPNPNTNPSSTGSPSGVSGQYCLYETSYSDVTIPGCGNTYKVVRTWTVLDWCTGEIVTQNNAGEDNQQIIDIVDDKAPQITMDDYEVNANNQGTHPQPCFSTELLKPANVSDNCSDFSVKIFTPVGEAIYVNGTDGANGGYIPSPGLPQGDHIITYQATDVCGNSINKEVIVTVTDLIAPVAICDEITDVNLSSGGTAEVFAETFDDGSYDQCCLDKFEVARMEDGCGVGTDFGPYATFCCEDAANSPVTVIFRAYDCDGNYNDCMVTVNVSDKKEPTLVNCPSPHTINCDFYNDNLAAAFDLGDYTVLDQFGSPEYIDNCDLTITPTIIDNVDECGNGTITRTWQAVDPSGNNAPACTQLIFVQHVSDWGVEFPTDETVTCGDDVPDFEEPKIFNESCELIAVSYEDVFYNVVPDACYKIARTWTIINWCVVGDQVDEEVIEVPESQLGLPFPQCDLDGDGDCDDRTFRDSWDGNSFPTAADAGSNGAPDTDIDLDPWDGYITYEQVIKISDSVSPVFADGCAIDDVCIEDNSCSAIIELPTPSIQDCSPDVQITVNSDLGSGYGPFIDVAPGTYTVTYSAMDQCGNSNACQTTFTVEDCKKPTPYCKNGLIVELMTTTPPMIEVWANDLDAGSFDNCPGDVQLSFSPNLSDQSITFDCDQVGQQFVELWVTDAVGNQDFCSTFVFVQANMGQCPMIDDPLLAGVVETESGEFVKDVEVNLNTNIGINDMMKTDETGDFHFNVPAGTDLTLTPVKDINPLNGVTTYDLVLISKHILNVDPLDSPYKIIAADANKSNTVTTFDLVVLRKLILFIDTELSNNTSWRFVPTDYDFVDPQNPLNESFPEIINVNNFNGIDDADFVGIKVGDVNGNADPLELTQVDDRTFIDQLKFQTEDQSLKAGESYTVNFKSNNFDAIGYQFTLNFDPTALEFIQVNNAIAQAENFGLTLLDEGVITASWNTDEVKKMAKEETIFSFTFKAKTDARLSQLLDINSRYTLAEAYRENGELLDIELEFNNSTVATAFELYQNRPNPFNEATVIGFQLPEASTATLTITDVSGRTLKVIKGDFERGYNEVTIQEKELQGSGIRYYQLETSNHTASKKMVLLGTK